LLNAHSGEADATAMLELIMNNESMLKAMETDIFCGSIKNSKYLIDLIGFVQDMKVNKTKQGTKRSIINLSRMENLVNKYNKK
jgi:hypothetical protein